MYYNFTIVDFPGCNNRLLWYGAIKLSVKTDFLSLFTVRKERERETEEGTGTSKTMFPTQRRIYPL